MAIAGRSGAAQDISAYFETLRIALIHDWLTGMRGGEKVLLELVRLLPSADVFTLFWKRGSVAEEIESRVRQTSFLNNMPAVSDQYRYYLPLFPAAIRSFDLAGYDLIFSSSHAVAKGVRVPPGALHLSYVHTPMRYVWYSHSGYFAFGRGRLWKRAALAAASPWLRRFDRRTAAGVHFFLANSENVRSRIRRVYGADATVIYPPVDTGFFTPGARPSPAGDYYLVVSSLEPYKRIDLAVDAFANGPRRLLIAGKGTLENELRRRAKPPVEFLGEVDQETLRELYRHCRALIFPGLEDFGIVPVEAQACGRPVVCYGAGGALETVIHGRTGVHFASQTVSALRKAVEEAEGVRWDASGIRANALRFSRRRFRQKVTDFLGGLIPLQPPVAGRRAASQV
jgi:glycosyltransferase involved in cell wall biosynthesis